MRKSLLATIVFLAISIVLFASAVFAAAEVGQPAPALVVPELSGQTFELAAQHGKVVVINFWATWCPPCRHEMPALDAFYRKYHSQGLEMLGVSVDRPRDASEVDDVMRSFSYPAAISDDAKVNDFGTPYSLPVTFVIDNNGILRAKLTPDEAPLTEQSLSRLVLPLLNRKPASQAPAGSRSSASGLDSGREYAGAYVAQSGQE
jgi:cytochrome c biogenesis protein CcmG, thiol:disulfide interchange protein DsbE